MDLALIQHTLQALQESMCILRQPSCVSGHASDHQNLKPLSCLVPSAPFASQLCIHSNWTSHIDNFCIETSMAGSGISQLAIIYLLLKGQTKPSINQPTNQPTNQWEKDIYGVYLLFSVIFPSFLGTKVLRKDFGLLAAHKLRQADFGIPAAAKGFVHHVLSFSEALISHGGTPSHHPAFRLGFSMKYSASSYWGQRTSKCFYMIGYFGTTQLFLS